MQIHLHLQVIKIKNRFKKIERYYLITMNIKEKKQILYNFPELELSYEKRLHNKVHNINCFMTIPYGLKYFAWFHNFKHQNMLIILKIDKKKNSISSIERKICCFDSSLCIGVGTIFYGTIFNYNNINFFNIEDIHYYKNNCLKDFSNLEKFKLEHHILENEIKQIIYKKNDLIFGLPIISQNYKDLYNIINKLPYRLYSIQHRFLKKQINIFYNEPVEQTIERFGIFQVEATVQPDIYLLKCYNSNNNLIECGVSYISSYKNSVKLNSLFRNIKENDNLDLLEESDDDEDFENISVDKYIKKIKINMKCLYNHKFKSWEPIMRSNEGLSLHSFILSQEK